VSRRRPSNSPPGRRSDGEPSRRFTQRPTEADVDEAASLLEVDDWAASDLVELREFLSCERNTQRADPDFRERLRMDLWWALMVQRVGGSGRLPRA
jgi:hypothetical protein